MRHNTNTPPRRAALAHFQLRLVTRTVDYTDVAAQADETYRPGTRAVREDRVQVIPSPIRGIDHFEFRVATPTPFEEAATKLRLDYGILSSQLHIRAREGTRDTDPVA